MSYYDELKNEETIKSIIKYATKRKQHAKIRFKEIQKSQGNDPISHCTYWAGKDLGYWQGKTEALDDLLDEINKIK